MRTKFWSENLKGRGHSEGLGIDGRIILELSEGNRMGGCGLDAFGLGYWSVAALVNTGSLLTS